MAPLTVGIELRDQSLPFMFEVMGESGLPDFTFVLPLPPESYRKGERPRASFTPTQGGYFEDKTGMGFPPISLQGTFGFLGTYGPGKSLDAADRDGWALYKQLEGALLDFHSRFGTGATRPVDPANPPTLRFYNFTDKDYFVVQIQKFEVLRNIQRRFLYQYDIQMVGLTRLDAPSAGSANTPSQRKDFLSDSLNTVEEVPPLSFWKKALNAYSAVYSGMATVVQTLSGLQDDLDLINQGVAGFKNGLSAFINAPFNMVQGAIATVDGIIKTVVSIEGLPHEVTNDLRETKLALLKLSLQPSRFHTPVADTGTVANDNRSAPVEILTSPIPGNISGVVGMDTPETTLFDPSLETTTDIAVSTIEVNDQDTIETLAQKSLGDSRQWQRIADLNGLEYPYVVATGLDQFSDIIGTGVSNGIDSGSDQTVVSGISPSPGQIIVFSSGNLFESATVSLVEGSLVILEGPAQRDFPPGTVVTLHERALAVLSVGSKAQVPGTAGQSMPLLASSDHDTQLFGTDESLDDGGSHDPDSGGDIGTVSGLSNLEMQLSHRLTTVQGELSQLGHSRYGSYLPKIIGKIGIPMWEERALVEAKITIQDDPRISRVGVVQFKRANDAIYLDAEVFPINQTTPFPMSILVG